LKQAYSNKKGITLKHKLPQHKLLYSLLIYVGFINIHYLNASENAYPKLQSLHQSMSSSSASSKKPPSVIFVESAIEKGIVFEHNERDYELSGLKDTLGNGVCIIDIDNDGFEDIFAVGGRGVTRRYGKKHWWNKDTASKLFHNINGHYFSDATQIINSADVISGYGCATGDLNNDGYTDIVVGGRGIITLLINQQGKIFNKKNIRLDKNAWPMSITLWDTSDDGYLDILVANFAKFSNDLKVGSSDYGYQSHSQFNSESFSGQQNLLLTNTTPLERNNAVNFTLSHLEGYDKSFSIAPLALLDSNTSTIHSGVLVANAKGSTSIIQLSHINDKSINTALFPWLSNIKTPLVQASNIQLLNESAILLTQHKTGGFLLYNINSPDVDDLSWQLGLNSDLDNISPSWATLIADFNNDGTDDLISAKGFSTPHIDNPFRPQGSRNTFKIQTTDGEFKNQGISVRPNLERSSKGAAFADFNNDGLLDVVFNNNNNNLSLYMNKSAPKNWLSLTCTPLYLCEKSTWEISDVHGNILATEHFSKNQPFLSSNQKRLHYAFNNFDKNINISVRFNDNSLQRYSDISLNTTYRINVKENSIHPVITPTNEKRVKPSLARIVNAPLVELLPMLSLTPQLSLSELITIAEYLKVYKLRSSTQSAALSPEFITLTSWLFNQALQHESLGSELMGEVIHLIGSSESSLFSDHIVYLIEALQEDNFCQLTKEIHQWYQEEETATKSKQLFKAPLIFKIINSHSAKEIICGLDAISVSRDTTLGQSLLALLHNYNMPLPDLKSVQAATVRTLGLLKNNKISKALIEFCKTSKDSLIIAECIISLNKLGTKNTSITKLFTRGELNRSILALHPDNIILAPALKSQVPSPLLESTETFDVKGYLSSPLVAHSMLAHLINLTSAQNETNKVQAMNHLLLTYDNKALIDIANRWHSLSPDSINNYFFLDGLPNHKLYWLLPFANNHTIERILVQYSNDDTSFDYDYVLAQQCQLRQSLKSLCNTHLSIHGYLNNQQFNTLLDENIVKIMYALMSDNLTKKKTTTISLFNYSMQLLENNMTNKQERSLELAFSLLRINNLYTLLNTNQVTARWLSKFVHSSQNKHLKLKKDWIDRQQPIKDPHTEEIIQLIKSTD